MMCKHLCIAVYCLKRVQVNTSCFFFNKICVSLKALTLPFIISELHTTDISKIYMLSSIKISFIFIDPGMIDFFWQTRFYNISSCDNKNNVCLCFYMVIEISGIFNIITICNYAVSNPFQGITYTICGNLSIL